MKFYFAVALISLAGCSQFSKRQEAVACEAFFKKAEGVEMSFSDKDISVVDRSSTFDELKRDYYPGKISELDQLHLASFEGKSLGIRTIGMTGDKPALVNGVTLNGLVCDFVLIGEKPYQDGKLVELAERAASNRELSRTAEMLNSKELKAIAPRWRDNSMCCIP